jgi:hypothetical protein
MYDMIEDAQELAKEAEEVAAFELMDKSMVLVFLPKLEAEDNTTLTVIWEGTFSRTSLKTENRQNLKALYESITEDSLEQLQFMIEQAMNEDDGINEQEIRH